MNEEESIRRRVDTVINEVEKRGFDTVIFTNEVYNQDPANFIYMAGSWVRTSEEHCSLILGVNGQSTLVLPHWGASKMEAQGLYDHVVPTKQEKGHHIRATKAAVEKYYDANKICFDLSTMSGAFAMHLLKSLNLKPSEEIDISDCVYRLRAIKDGYEVDQLRKAIMITEGAVLNLVENAKPGTKTGDLKTKLDAKMIELGAVGFAFNSSISFARGPGRSPGIIKHGDVLSVDVGCRVASGYCSDMGRTWPITFDAEVKEFLNRAVSAHKDAMKVIKDGVIASDVLKESNRINEEYQLDGGKPLSTLRCGHQIGLDCHDYTMPFAPNFGPLETDQQSLKEGMTLTFEPFHTDREKPLRTHFEDIVLVGKDGPVVLNTLPWDFLW